MKEANRQGWEACGGMCRMGKGREQVVERGKGGRGGEGRKVGGGAGRRRVCGYMRLSSVVLVFI